MDDFTAANIAVSDEKREEELEKVKRGKVDYSKLEAEVEEAKSNALEVFPPRHLHIVVRRVNSQSDGMSTAMLQRPCVRI